MAENSVGKSNYESVVVSIDNTKGKNKIIFGLILNFLFKLNTNCLSALSPLGCGVKHDQRVCLSQ